MGNISKLFCILLVVIFTASSLVMTESANAQSVPKPSVPEFTVQINDRSYDVPTSYSIDQFTGEIITHEGYHVDNRTIEIIVKNQDYSAYKDDDIHLCYNLSVKGHFGDVWMYYPENKGYLASDSAYTTITFDDFYRLIDNHMISYTPRDWKIDFRVQAMIGSYHVEWVSFNAPDSPLAGYGIEVFTGEMSDWSDTKTITLEADTNTPIPDEIINPSPTPPETPPETPTVTPTLAPLSVNNLPDQTWLVAVGIGVAAAIAVAAVALTLRRRTPNETANAEPLPPPPPP